MKSHFAYFLWIFVWFVQCKSAISQSCYWSGTSPFCAGECRSNHVEVYRDDFGDGLHCIIGTKAFCCSKDIVSRSCYWAGTAPFCSGTCNGADQQMGKSRYGDGYRCYLGWKAYCCPLPTLQICEAVSRSIKTEFSTARRKRQVLKDPLKTLHHTSTNTTTSDRTKRETHEYFRFASLRDLIRPEFQLVPVDEYANNNPIYRYYTRQSQVRDRNGRWTTVALPQIVQARIHTWNLRDRGQDRSNFGPEFNNLMAERGAAGYAPRLEDYRPKDEKGHIIASQLGGPAQHYNLVPQTPAINGNRGVPENIRRERLGWLNLEHFAYRWVNEHCGWVQWDVAINYDPNHARAKGMKLFIQFFRGDGESNLRFTHYYDNTLFDVSSSSSSSEELR